MKSRIRIIGGCLASLLVFVVSGTVAADVEKKPMPPAWLVRINMYRAMAELPPLANDEALTEGSQKHAMYLVKNYAKSVRAGEIAEADLSTESSSHPFYTHEGKVAANHSEMDFDYEEHPSQDRAIDRWIEGPVHRMLLLNPDLRRIGYGYYCEGGFCAQAVNVVDGIAQEAPDPDKQLAIEFPPVSSSISLSDLTREDPNPLTACPGYEYPVGLPITFEIGSYVGAKLTDYSIVKEDAPPGAPPIEACGYDAFSYRNQSRAQLGQVIGRLKAFSGVVVIPRHPLAAGNYRASVTVNGKDYSWPFTIAPNGSQSAAR